MKIALMFGLLLIVIANACAAHDQAPSMEILVNGAPVPTYFHKGTTYLEAIKGKEYEIRLTNPLGIRVAVALAVDGLNTIDARHTEARRAQKWVLEPHQSIVLSGWQTNENHARRFFFTTEERSYGAWLNQTQNLGIISAVFFKEKFPVPQPAVTVPSSSLPLQGAVPSKRSERAQNEKSGEADAQSMHSMDKPKAAPAPSEYAATGIGKRIQHEVETIYMELEDHPFATLNLRYEFRPELVRLGVLSPLMSRDPLIRREHARGFRDSAYCPEP